MTLLIVGIYIFQTVIVNMMLFFTAFFPFSNMEYSHENITVMARKIGLFENMVIPIAKRKKIRLTAGWQHAKALPSPSPFLKYFIYFAFMLLIADIGP